MTKNSVTHASYLRNHSSYDYHLWCICVKWWYLQAFFFFFIFRKFWFFGLLERKSGKNDPKLKKILFVVVNVLRTIHHMIALYWTSVSNDNYSRVSFHFFKIFIIRVARWVKVQKRVQNYYPSCSISQESCIIWFSFMVLMCKLIISPGMFFSFSKFWFFGLLEG